MTPREWHEMAYAARRAQLDAAFWDRIDRSGGLGACWPWTGARQRDTQRRRGGYGIFDRFGKHCFAHREALQRSLGRPIADGMFVIHSCDNPPCCNPSHLREATHAENMRDMAAKGRGAGQLPVVYRERALRLYEQGYGCRAIGCALGVSPSAIQRLIQSTGVQRHATGRYDRKLYPLTKAAA